MTNFSISVEVEDDIDPLSIERVMDYIVNRLQSEKVLRVTNIIRDY